ncbi:AMP-binding protein [Marinivivus vitaminiproducens]|uniref:AMP-binding protein n=1 Tax=Marinivivus vitaminiproducens TaxID=3035935 RepID=UPI00279FB23C|nr:AMP-binding protein [Geminicoccaceae bacterium SCSIO 64248]
MSILDVLERRAFGDQADAMHFVHDDAAPVEESACDSWTWRELRDRARGVAAELTDAGVESGSRVLLVYPAGLGFVASFYGCLYAGAVPVPVPAPRRKDGLDRWRHIARNAGISGVLASADLVAILRPLLEGLDGGFCLALDPADASRPYVAGDHGGAPRFTPSQVAFLQYTSGSTSEPKGVMVTHGAMMANLGQISRGFDLSPSRRMVSWLPHYHDMGLIGCILSPLYDGYPVSLMAPASFLRRPLRWLALASMRRATIYGGPNFAFEHCVRRSTPEMRAGLDLSATRLAFTGAEIIRPETLARFHDAFAAHGFRWEFFHACYGMAEATLYVSSNPPSYSPVSLSVSRDELRRGRARDVRLSAGDVRDPSRIELASCGRAAGGVALAIVDPATLERQGDGEVGEIWIAGPNVAPGYWGQPETSAEAFGFELGGQGGWFRSGDLGFRHDGQLYVTGRRKDVIIIRGDNHYPQDIEATAAEAHPALAGGGAGAFAVEIAGEERLGILCEVSREAMRKLDAEGVMKALRAAIAWNHDVKLAVAALVGPGRLPRTPSGKVRRFACRDGTMAGTMELVARWDARIEDDVHSGGGWMDRLQAEPPARREGVLRRLLQQELAVLASMPEGRLPPTDEGFFDLGLDSLATVDFAATLEDELGVNLTPALLFEHPTIAALATHLAAGLAGDPAEAGPSVAAAGAERTHDAVASEMSAEIAAIEALLRAERDLVPPVRSDGPSRHADGDGR